MFQYKLQPAHIKFPKGTFSLSKKIGSAAGNSAITVAHSSLKEFQNAENADSVLEVIHQNLADLDTIITAQNKEIDSLRCAANALSGMDFTMGEELNRNLIDSAMQVRAMFDAIKISNPDADDSDIKSTIENLKVAAQALEDDMVTTENRKRIAEAKCKTATLHAIAYSKAEPLKLISKFCPPDDIYNQWKELIDPDGYTSDSIRNITDKSHREHLNNFLREEAKSIIAEEKKQSKLSSKERRKQRRDEYSKNIASVWEGI